MSFDLVNAFPTLQGAPITEAVIDFRVELPSEVTLSDLSAFNQGRGMESRFTERAERRSFEARIEIQPSAPPKVVTPPDHPDGYVFHSQEDLLLAQARLDGFTLSRLQPYHNGDVFQKQARDLWERYVAVARPVKVKRLAIRNVNRIEMDPGSEIQRYILTGPEISRALPQQMLHFFMRIVVPDATSGALVIINETIAPALADALTIPLILDIDAFREVDLTPNSPEIWETLRALRVLKNRIFFRSLTAEALEKFR